MLKCCWRGRGTWCPAHTCWHYLSLPLSCFWGATRATEMPTLTQSLLMCNKRRWREKWGKGGNWVVGGSWDVRTPFSAKPSSEEPWFSWVGWLVGLWGSHAKTGLCIPCLRTQTLRLRRDIAHRGFGVIWTLLATQQTRSAKSPLAPDRSYWEICNKFHQAETGTWWPVSPASWCLVVASHPI